MLKQLFECKNSKVLFIKAFGVVWFFVWPGDIYFCIFVTGLICRVGNLQTFLAAKLVKKNVGDPSSISGLGHSLGEGIVYLLPYSEVSLVAQMVKSLPSVWETWV